MKLSFLGRAILSVSLLLCIALNPLTCNSYTLEVTEDFTNFNGLFSGKLDDGTILGFYYLGQNEGYQNSARFLAAVTSATVIELPEAIICEDQYYELNVCGWGNEEYYLDQAPNLTKIIFPTTTYQIHGVFPNKITDIELNTTEPPYLWAREEMVDDNTTIWVPKEAFQIYQRYCLSGIDGWSPYFNVKYQGYEPMFLSLEISQPGTLGKEILKNIEMWEEVEELQVKGKINDDDMEIFGSLTALSKLDLTETDITTIKGCSNLQKLRTVLLPSTVTKVNDNAFYNCRGLSDINIPNVTEIGDIAFQNCSKLESIQLQNVKKLGGGAFAGSGLREVELPQVSQLDKYCFENCINLSRVILPEYLDRIPESCFSYAYNLNSVNFPLNLKSIESGAFTDCSLKEVVLPEGLLEIQDNAFYGNKSLKKVSIPATIISIGHTSFNDTALEDYFCYAAVPPLNCGISDFSTNAKSLCKLYVPAFSLEDYRLSRNWRPFSEVKALEGKVKDIFVATDYNLTTTEGIEDKVNLNIAETGALTINTPSRLNIRNFTLTQNLETKWGYDDNWNWIESGHSTLITNSEAEADNVAYHLLIPMNSWYFITLPFDVKIEDISYPTGTQWVIRKYSGEDRAALTGKTWQNMTNGMTMEAGKGYIIQCYNELNSYDSEIEFIFPAADNDKKNGALTSQNVSTPLNTFDSEYAHNRSWNLVGNPYPAYLSSTSIEHDGTITIYDGYKYLAYSLQDDDFLLKPGQAFFVQAQAENSSITFFAQGRKHFSNIKEATDTTGYYSYSTRAVDQERFVMNFTLSNDKYSDRARLVVNPKAKMDYELNCDASKFMSDDPLQPQIYICDNGITYSIDERPLADGIINLGVVIGENGSHTISLNCKGEYETPVLLIDKNEGLTIDLTGQDYTFNAQPGTYESRFEVRVGEEATSVESLSANSAADIEIYDIQGRKVRNSDSLKGIYIEKSAEGKSRKFIK